jgi:hypothetical protein
MQPAMAGRIQKQKKAQAYLFQSKGLEMIVID